VGSPDLALDAASTLAVELSADLVGAAVPALVIGDELALGGRFEATLADGLAPAAGNVFAIATAAAVDGNFTSFALPSLASGLHWQLNAAPSGLSLAVLSGGPPPGDYDYTGAADGRDFLTWQRGGSPNPQSPTDLAAWQMTFGTSASAPPGAAVPEPNAAILFLTAVATLRLRSRRRSEHRDL
jgi:hypothetical protein